MTRGTSNVTDGSIATESAMSAVTSAFPDSGHLPWLGRVQ